jgi:hypothetical protein
VKLRTPLEARDTIASRAAGLLLGEGSKRGRQRDDFDELALFYGPALGRPLEASELARRDALLARHGLCDVRGRLVLASSAPEATPAPASASRP